MVAFEVTITTKSKVNACCGSHRLLWKNNGCYEKSKGILLYAIVAMQSQWLL
jgi:hypothetical protein